MSVKQHKSQKQENKKTKVVIKPKNERPILMAAHL